MTPTFPPRNQAPSQTPTDSCLEGVRAPSGKILQLVHTLNLGGAERLAERFARRLGGPATMLFACLDDFGSSAGALRSDGYTVEHLGRKPGFLDLGCCRRLADLCQRENVQVIHAHQSTPFTIAAVSRGWHRKPRILFTEHGRFFPDRRNWKWCFLHSRLFGKSDRATAVGHGVKAALSTNEGLPAHRIEVVYNGVPIAVGRATPTDCAAIRREMGVPSDAYVILTAGRLDPIKDHVTAISATSRMAEQWTSGRPVVHWLAGDGPERSRLQDFASRSHAEQVQFLGERTDLPRLMSAADVVLLTSVSEGVPLVLIEAMAARLPVVATAVGGVPEVVVDGETGFLHKVQDSAGLAISLQRLADSQEQGTRMGEAGRLRAEQLFDEEKMLARYAEIYASLCGAQP